MLDPGIKDGLGVVRSQLEGMLPLLAVGMGIDPFGQERPGLVAQGARLAQADRRVFAQADALLLAKPTTCRR